MHTKSTTNLFYFWFRLSFDLSRKQPFLYEFIMTIGTTSIHSSTVVPQSISDEEHYLITCRLSPFWYLVTILWFK